MARSELPRSTEQWATRKEAGSRLATFRRHLRPTSIWVTARARSQGLYIQVVVVAAAVVAVVARRRAAWRAQHRFELARVQFSP